MKRFIFSLIALSALYAFSTPTFIKPGLSYSESNNTYTITFNMPDFDVKTDTFFYNPNFSNNPSVIEEGVFFSRIKPYCDEFDYITEDGRPELPFYSMNLLLPEDVTYFQVTKMDIIDSIVIVLPFDYTPSQERVSYGEEYSYDADYYENFDNTWYWNYYTLDTVLYRQYIGLTFSIFPCRYEPSTRTLTIITDATFEISFGGSLLSNYIDNIGNSELFVYNFFDNFQGLPPLTIIPPIDGDEYLIIADDNLVNESSMLSFIAHKENLGYNVTLTSVHDVGETPADIRTYIQSSYLQCNTKYVLLVGNPDALPFYEGIAGDEDNPPSDFYYSCHLTNFHFPWPTVFIGRWPISIKMELDSIVDKTIASDLHLGESLRQLETYEIGLFSGTDPDIARSNFFYDDCKYIYDNIVISSNCYSGEVVDGRSFNSESSAEGYLKDYLQDNNNNPTWIFIYRGHGENEPSGLASPYKWRWFEIKHAETNTLDFQPFGFGFTCWLGNVYQNNNFARSWLTSMQGGPSFLGSTTVSYSNHNRYFSRTMFNQLKKESPLMTIGEFVGSGKLKYYMGTTQTGKFLEIKKYVLYGDPSLYLFGLNIDYNTPYLFQLPPRTKDNEMVIVKDSSLELSTYAFNSSASTYIYSITGQLVRRVSTNQIDLQGLPLGVYTVIINSENNQLTHKIILQ